MAGCRGVVVSCSLGCGFASDGTGGKEVDGEDDHDSSHGDRWCNCFIYQSGEALVGEHDKGMHEEMDKGSRDDNSGTKVTEDLKSRVESEVVFVSGALVQSRTKKTSATRLFLDALVPRTTGRKTPKPLATSKTKRAATCKPKS